MKIEAEIFFNEVMGLGLSSISPHWTEIFKTLVQNAFAPYSFLSFGIKFLIHKTNYFFKLFETCFVHIRKMIVNLLVMNSDVGGQI